MGAQSWQSRIVHSWKREIWSDTFFERKVVSKDHFLSLTLLQNSLIRINNAPVFCNNWLTQDITKVKHLMDENSLNFFSLGHFQNRYNIRVKPLMFFGIVSAVKSLQRQIPRTHQQYESPLNTFLKGQKSSRIAYKQLIANKSEKPTSCIDKWHKDIHSSTDKNADWRNVFQAANTCTTSSKLIDFNFRFLHRRLPTNSYLQKIGVKEDGKCTFCHDEKEDLTHLFWKCQKTKNFWDNFSIWLQSCQILQPGSYLDMTTALGLTPDSSSFKLHINFCCLIAKIFIWICRSKECFSIHNSFLFYLRHIPIRK